MKQAAKEAFENNMHHYDTIGKQLQSRVFCTRGNSPDFARIEAKENLCSFLKKVGNPHKPQIEKIKETRFYLFQKNGK